MLRPALLILALLLPGVASAQLSTAETQTPEALAAAFMQAFFVTKNIEKAQACFSPRGKMIFADGGELDVTTWLDTKREYRQKIGALPWVVNQAPRVSKSGNVASAFHSFSVQIPRESAPWTGAAVYTMGQAKGRWWILSVTLLIDQEQFLIRETDWTQAEQRERQRLSGGTYEEESMEEATEEAAEAE